MLLPSLRYRSGDANAQPHLPSMRYNVVALLMHLGAAACKRPGGGGTCDATEC